MSLDPEEHTMTLWEHLEELRSRLVKMIVAFLTSTGQNQPRPDLPGKIRVPVLLPVGTDDVVITPERADQMARTFPDARVVRLKGAGRLLPLESPEEFNGALRQLWTGPAARR